MSNSNNHLKSNNTFNFTNLPKDLVLNKKEVFHININNEYKDLIKDLYKFIIVFLSITILFTYSDSSLSTLVKTGAFELFLFVVIGLCAYHLVLKKLVTLS